MITPESLSMPEPDPWSEAITLPPEPQLPSWSLFESIWTPSWRDPPMPCLLSDSWAWYGEESKLFP